MSTFSYVYTTIPPDVIEEKPGQLKTSEVKQFFQDGFIIVKDFFKPEELEPCRNACAGLVEEIAQKLYKAGKIKRLYEEYGVFQRLTEIKKECPGAAILMFKQGKMPKEFQDLWHHPKLLNLAEQMLGPDVSGHPVWNLRIKVPQDDLTTVPWHQDNAYFSKDAYDHLVLTTWIPFLDTHADNGGMQMMRGGHRSGKTAKHTCCPGDTWFVDLAEDEMVKTLGVDPEKDVVTCNVPYGGFILFNNAIPHRSLHNISNDIRWSVDLRWQSPSYKWGFYDIAEGIHFRSKGKTIPQPDWDKFFSVNRKEVWQKKHFKEVLQTDEFDTTVTGPWIGRWEITNKNRHTLAFTNNAI